MPVLRLVLPALTAALPLLLLSGCAWLPQADTSGGLRASGMLQLTGDGARLETCAGQVHVLHVDEALRSVFDRVAQPGQNLIFVDLRGELLGDNSIRPVTLVRLGARGDGCADRVARDSQWVAVGERPDWLVRIAAQGLQMTTLGDEWQPMIIEQLPDGSRSFRSLDGEPVELWVYPQPCFSRLGGHYYQHTVRLLTAGESFAGCAYPGHLAASQPPR